MIFDYRTSLMKAAAAVMILSFCLSGCGRTSDREKSVDLSVTQSGIEKSREDQGKKENDRERVEKDLKSDEDQDVSEDQDKTGQDKTGQDRTGQNKTRQEQSGEDSDNMEKNIKNSSREDEEEIKTYLTAEQLREIGGLTAEEMKDLNVDAFVKTYDLTEDTVFLYDLHHLVKSYKLKNQESYPDYGYIEYAVAGGKYLKEENVRDIRSIVVVKKEETYEKSRIIDIGMQCIYDGDGMNLLEGGIDRYTPAEFLTQQKSEKASQILKEIEWDAWKKFGGSENAAGLKDRWQIYFTMKDTDTIAYSGLAKDAPVEIEQFFSL